MLAPGSVAIARNLHRLSLVMPPQEGTSPWSGPAWRSAPPSGAFTTGLFAPVHRVMRHGLRFLVIGVGGLLMTGGFVLALLPGHLGLPLLAVGLILVLRNSPGARRQFIRLQRKHPRIVFPIRRLIRRDPEIFPVLWQQALRVEKMIIPSRFRRASIWRRRYLRPRRAD